MGLNEISTEEIVRTLSRFMHETDSNLKDIRNRIEDKTVGRDIYVIQYAVLEGRIQHLELQREQSTNFKRTALLTISVTFVASISSLLLQVIPH